MLRSATRLDRKSSVTRKFRQALLEQLEGRLLLNAEWQNPARPIDVNNDMMFSPLDALLVINHINASEGFGKLPARTNSLSAYVDTNGDGNLSPIDVLLVINRLNQSAELGNTVPRVEGESEVAPAGFISLPMMVMPGGAHELIEISTSMSLNSREFNEMGLFVVDDADGRVSGVLPASPDYGRMVFESQHRRVLYSRADLQRSTSAVVMPAGHNVHVYVLQATSANGDPNAHLRVRQTGSPNIRIGWEEHAPISNWPIVGDRGYDDVIVDVQLGAPYVGRSAPVIQFIPNQSHPEETQLVIQPIVSDSDLPDDMLIFALDAAPPGATIDASTGQFRWTPTEAQGPGSYQVTLRATDRDGLFDTESFLVNVLEVNRPPLLQPLLDHPLHPGDMMTRFAVATDPDLPANRLTFSLDVGAPAGATIDASTGHFEWTAPEVSARTEFPVTVRVTDDGTPRLFATQSFTVTVTPLVDNCPFDDQLSDWTIIESGGSTTGRGTVVTANCMVTLTEGDSFVVGLERSFTIPETPTAIQFTYDSLTFDTSDPNFINDAFEVALVDRDGNALVAPFAPGRDAFFNVTEGMQAALGQGIQVDGNTITVGLNGIPVGTKAKIIFRLANNDADEKSTVSVKHIAWIESDLVAPTTILSQNSRHLGLGQEATIFQPVVSTLDQFKQLRAISAKSGAVESFAENSGLHMGFDLPQPEVNEIGGVVYWQKTDFAEFPDSNQVVTTPVVIDLNQNGIPEIIFTTYSNYAGFYNFSGSVLRAVSGLDGSELWSTTGLFGGGGLAVGDLNRDGYPEIIGVAEDLHSLVAFSHDGNFKWQSDASPNLIGLGAPSIADLDGDGVPEIIVGATVFDFQGRLLSAL